MARNIKSYLDDYADGYRTFHGDGEPMIGECFYFVDMFEPFKLQNHGLVGGSRTVDDFTPDGLGCENPVEDDDDDDYSPAGHARNKLYVS